RFGLDGQGARASDELDGLDDTCAAPDSIGGEHRSRATESCEAVHRHDATACEMRVEATAEVHRPRQSRRVHVWNGKQLVCDTPRSKGFGGNGRSFFE